MNRNSEDRYTKEYYQKNKDKIKARAKKWYIEHHELCLERAREYNKKWYYQKKTQVMTHYCNGDIHCVLHRQYFPNDQSITDLRILAIDHINGGGTKHYQTLKASGNGRLYSWLIKNNFPSGFQVVCHNCNWMKRYTNKECG